MPKKEGEGQQEPSNKDGSVKNTANGESLAASVVSSNPERQGSSSGQEGTENLRIVSDFDYDCTAIPS